VAVTDAERDAAAADLAVLREQIKHERELREMTTRMADAERARQASEYERRLEELNGAHARALQDRTELVQKSVYDLTQRDLAAWKLQVTAENTVLAERLRADQVATADRLRKDAADMANAIAHSQRLVSTFLGVLMFVLAVVNFILAHGAP
jgi:hypothetical protein